MWFQPNATLMNIKEGLETHMFWNTLGGKRSYPDHHEPKDSAKDPRLFSCHFKRGKFVNRYYSSHEGSKY
jgi:gelsolin